VQLDYAMPARFHLEYTDVDGSKKTPIMIHCALIGSIERFMSVYLEHSAGWLPMWCAPENVRILTVNDQVADYIGKITNILDGVELNDPLPHNKMRYTVDDSADSLGKKIRRATSMKIPCVIIIGPKDVESNTVSVRLRDKEEKIKFDELARFLENLK
jgi:threonyl-tRNA synthetase